jgi:hypothetical protein
VRTRVAVLLELTYDDLQDGEIERPRTPPLSSDEKNRPIVFELLKAGI